MLVQICLFVVVCLLFFAYCSCSFVFSSCLLLFVVCCLLFFSIGSVARTFPFRRKSVVCFCVVFVVCFVLLFSVLNVFGGAFFCVDLLFVCFCFRVLGLGVGFVGFHIYVYG